MKRNPLKLLSPLLSATTLLALIASPAHAVNWSNPDGGDWSDGNNWSGGNPPSPTQTAEFPWLNTSTDPLEVLINGNTSARLVNIGSGFDVILQLGSGAIFTTDSAWRVGFDSVGTGTGPSRLTILGSTTGTSTVNLTNGPANGQIFILSGSSLVLSGSNLSVSSPSTTTLYNGGSSLLISEGATFSQAGLRVGQITTGTGNSSNDHAIVESGGILEVSGPSHIGNNVGHHKNYIHVTGTDSQFISEGDITIGNNPGSNHGGNYLLVESGAKVTSSTNLNIRGYTVAEADHGSNRVTIGNGGTLTSNGMITVGHNTATTYADALLQLSEGGTLDGNTTIRINNGSRFEAAGSGLGNQVTTEVRSGGTVAVGLNDATTASQLTLASTMNFDSGGQLEFTLYADQTFDSLEIVSGGSITGIVSLILDTSESMLNIGSSYTLFTGNTTAITASFNLDNLDSQIWDISRFNEAGGWELVVVPEASTLVIFFSLPLILSRFLLVRIRNRYTLYR